MIFSIDFVHVTFLLVTFFFFFGFFTCDLSILVFFYIVFFWFQDIFLLVDGCCFWCSERSQHLIVKAKPEQAFYDSWSCWPLYFQNILLSFSSQEVRVSLEVLPSFGIGSAILVNCFTVCVYFWIPDALWLGQKEANRCVVTFFSAAFSIRARMAALASAVQAKLLESKSMSQPPVFRFTADPAITVVQLELVLQTFLQFKKTSSLRSFRVIFCIFDPHSIQDIMKYPFGFSTIPSIWSKSKEPLGAGVSSKQCAQPNQVAKPSSWRLVG